MKIAEVVEEAEKCFAYYQEREPDRAVRESMTCILSDLGKCGEEGAVILKTLDMAKFFRVMMESDDTQMWKLIEILKENG